MVVVRLRDHRESQASLHAAGGVLTGKYLDSPAAVDDTNRDSAMSKFENPRGRMDEAGWGRTLYRYRSGPADLATREYAKLAKMNGMSLTEMCLRWARGRPSVTTTLLGHTSMAQVDPIRNPNANPYSKAATSQSHISCGQRVGVSSLPCCLTD